MRTLGERVLWVVLGVQLFAGCSCETPRAHSSRDASVAPVDAEASAPDRSVLRPDRPPLDSTIASETQCDGIDNDGNGIIDDVDLGMDGLCDCLRIATLGTPAFVGPSDVFGAWLDARSANGATALGTQPLTAAALSDVQVLVLQNTQSRAFDAAELDAIEAWIRGGGGLFTLTGYSVFALDVVNVNSVLERAGLEYGTDSVLFSPLATVAITTWNPHPVSELITQIGFNNGYPVLGGGTIVAEQDGVVVLRAAELGEGRVLAWGDEWITINSEWVEHPEYDVERFWLNAMKWLAPPTECQVPIELF